MSFFGELKRRNVIRVGLAYVLMGWVLLQGADFAFDLIGAPNWVIQSLTVIVAIGLPIALFFAWAFELTPEGIKREEDVDRSQTITPRTGRKLDRAIILFLVLVIAMMGIERFYFADGEPESSTPTASANKTIAVLPFVNMSPDAEQEYFSDGITEEILNRLARVEGLQVTARTSTFSFKGQNLDVREIAETLGVESILEGSVRRDGNQVRITAQLIRASDGFHLWSESFDRKLESIFAVQDEISSEIANALQVSLGITDSSTPTRQVNPAAYDLYLRARSLHRARGPGVVEAIRLFEESLAIDQDFAPAWAGLAHSLQVVEAYATFAELEQLGDIEQRADEAASRAIALDPELPTALHAKANALLAQYRWAEAEGYFGLAIAADPDSTEIMEDLAGFYYYTLQLEKARSVVDRMIALDPVVFIFRWQGVNAYYGLGNVEKRDEHLAAALAITREMRILNLHKLGTFFERGDIQGAHDWVAQIPLPDWAPRDAMHRMVDWTQNPTGPLDQDMRAALTYYVPFAAWAGRDDLWAETVWNTPWLTYWENAPSIIAALASPILDDHFGHLIGHPTTLETIERIRLPEYWRENGWPDVCAPVGDDDFRCE